MGGLICVHQWGTAGGRRPQSVGRFDLGELRPRWCRFPRHGLGSTQLPSCRRVGDGLTVEDPSLPGLAVLPGGNMPAGCILGERSPGARPVVLVACCVPDSPWGRCTYLPEGGVWPKLREREGTWGQRIPPERSVEGAGGPVLNTKRYTEQTRTLKQTGGWKRWWEHCWFQPVSQMVTMDIPCVQLYTKPLSWTTLLTLWDAF